MLNLYNPHFLRFKKPFNQKTRRIISRKGQIRSIKKRKLKIIFRLKIRNLKNNRVFKN